MSTLTLTFRPAAQDPLAGAGARCRSLWDTWQQRARQRRQLAELDDRQLDDIGISRAEALCEAAKPFWRA
jgi:uncharacterized protein YjiS (DUF1127 family)